MPCTRPCSYPKTLRHALSRSFLRKSRDFAVSCEEHVSIRTRLRKYFAQTSLTFCARTSFNYLIFIRRAAVARRPVGQGRFELPTPRLSSACSNQLSYWPATHVGSATGRQSVPQDRIAEIQENVRLTGMDQTEVLAFTPERR
jgi:hypothetical protein